MARTEFCSKDMVASRWRVCLHEAGHAVAGRLVLKRGVRAVVYDDNVGGAYVDVSIPRTFEEALVIAAGPAAESLVEKYPAPEVPPPPALKTTYRKTTAPLMADLRQSPSDAAAIARWCIGGVEGQPERWSSRFYWIHREADLFVTRHQGEIVDAATGLYQRGIVTLEADPVRPRPAQVPPPHRQHNHRIPSPSRRSAVPIPPADPSPGRKADVPPR